jgi:glycosyltransferase involved in cell wall biosynthesis
MKIAQIAPLMESVPPRLYGGTERVVSYLTDELVHLGHDVTLFASGDSISSAKLVRCVPMALRLDANVSDPIPYYMLMLDRVRELADEFDILHFHIDQFHFPLFRLIAHRTLTTLHGRQDLHDLKAFYVGFSDMPLVAISNAQRKPIANANLSARFITASPFTCLSRLTIAASTWRFSDVSLQRSGPTAPFGSPRRSTFPSRSRPRSTKLMKPISAQRSRRFLINPGWNMSARLMSAPRALSSARRVRCCSRSTGPSRSDYR